MLKSHLPASQYTERNRTLESLLKIGLDEAEGFNLLREMEMLDDEDLMNEEELLEKEHVMPEDDRLGSEFHISDHCENSLPGNDLFEPSVCVKTDTPQEKNPTSQDPDAVAAQYNENFPVLPDTEKNKHKWGPVQATRTSARCAGDKRTIVEKVQQLKGIQNLEAQNKLGHEIGPEDEKILVHSVPGDGQNETGGFLSPADRLSATAAASHKWLGS